MGSQAVFVFCMVHFPGLPRKATSFHNLLGGVGVAHFFLHLPIQEIVLCQFDRHTFILSDVKYQSMCVLVFCVSFTAVLYTIVLDGF